MLRFIMVASIAGSDFLAISKVFELLLKALTVWLKQTTETVVNSGFFVRCLLSFTVFSLAMLSVFCLARARLRLCNSVE